MISSLDASSERFLQTMRETNQRLERAQRQVASGKRLEFASDDPDSVGALIEVRAQVSRLDQISSNFSRLQTEIATVDAALQDASKLVDRVRTLGAEGANGLANAEKRVTLAGEVGAILDRLIAISNTEVDGRYLFSGDSDGVAPFSYDALTMPPWTYEGTTASRRALHPNGSSFAMARSGDEVFANLDSAKNVFKTVADLQTALLANDATQIQAALDPLGSASNHLNQQIAFYGNVQSQILDGANYAARLKVQLNTEKASFEEADITEALVTLQQVKFQQEAALQVRSKAPQTSLFEYLG